jgi:hypothetical protein
MPEKVSNTTFVFPKYQTDLESAQELKYSFETTGFVFVQTHPKCRNMITKAGADVGKLSSKYILVVNTTHFSRTITEDINL